MNPPRTLIQLLSERSEGAAATVGYTFLADDGVTESDRLTFGDLHHNACMIGAVLSPMAGAGARALLLYPPGLEFISGFFGCLYAGVIAVPAYPPTPPLERTLPRLRSIIQDAGATIVLTTAALEPLVKSFIVADPLLAHLLVLATDSIHDADPSWAPPAVKPDAIAFLQYTSGSTSEPKGVIVSHENLIENSRQIRERFGLGPSWLSIFWLPVYHDMGLIGGVLQGLYAGYPAVLMSPLDFLRRPVRWLQAMSRYKASVAGAPNFAYELCVRKTTPADRASLDLSHWRVAFNGAEPIRAETLARFADAFAACGFNRKAFLPCYGLAESTLLVAGEHFSDVVPLSRRGIAEKQAKPPADESDTQEFVPSGPVVLGHQIVVVDPDTLRPCAPGGIGEICVSGPSVAQGYWNRPELTAEMFNATLSDGRGPVLRTGDLGFIRDGRLFVVGRRKDLIIVRGKNHYPQDIELTAQKCHSVLRPGCCAALGSVLGGEEGVVLVAEVERRSHTERRTVDAATDETTPTGGRGRDRRQIPTAPDLTVGDADLALSDVAARIRDEITAEHGVPVHAVALIVAGSLPKTSSGKIQRFRCAELLRSGQLQALHIHLSEKNQSVASILPIAG